MKSIYSRMAIIAVLLSSLATGSVFADERAQAIVRRVDELDRSITARSSMEMSVRPADGGASRTFSVLSYDRSGAEEASLVEFVEPRSVRGLRILSKGSDSWVFFPSTGRVRKIAGSSRSGSVQGVGGDFSYDDLGGGAWADDYDFAIMREDAGHWELEGKKKSVDAAYDSVKLHVDKKRELPTLATFALEKESGYFKELSFSDFRDFGGKTRAAKMVMKNLKKNSSTVVILAEAAFDLPLEDRLFDPSRFDK
ncbi:MAG: hypothetical protein A2Z99_19955 [Treponema sp. GWB1_62_6]|nr:MAG: hypothetical protein A2001_09530 [Treponema sp. GWC1_61_84]OHE69422.1 MAG: hypothetical protein A2Z99_19955 [Treponema sp. GWB1_62_6]OHE71278.1 MAG: hypothetical protein A2413_19705 [Treponema sp. RIFOXYC1_FULL_61_9]HCM28797.1 hypothetical protein [Treponema sp.]